MPIFHRFHANSKLCEHLSSETVLDKDETEKLLRQFITLESKKPFKLKGALESLLEADEANRKLSSKG